MDSYQWYQESKKPKKKNRGFIVSTPLIDIPDRYALALISSLSKFKADLKAADAPLLKRLDIHKNS